jgi:tRNA(Ile)-lysidine synthetase-like protein
MALLDMLAKQAAAVHGTESKLRFVVAHYDHGIRPDSAEDRLLVQAAAKRYKLPFVYEEGNLGAAASEAHARHTRYVFLEKVRQAAGAQAIITAHHEDDMLETAILNILRGTGRKGLTSLASRRHILRPLLKYTKRQIIAYARENNLQWREDSTNVDERYARNYIRHRLLPRFSEEDRARLLGIIERSRQVGEALDAELANLMHIQPATNMLERRAFTSLPHVVAREFLAAWLRARGIRGFDRGILERVVIAAKTQRIGTSIDIMEHASLRVGRGTLALVTHER